MFRARIGYAKACGYPGKPKKMLSGGSRAKAAQWRFFNGGGMTRRAIIKAAAPGFELQIACHDEDRK